MNAWMLPLAGWLLDFSLLASVVLIASIALRWCFRDAAPRVALAWGTWLGLAALAMVTALPQWPRVTLWPATNRVPAVILVAERLPAPSLVEAPVLPEASFPAQETENPPEIAPAANHPWRTALVLSWLVLAVVAALWIVIGLWQTRRLVCLSKAAAPWIVGELREITRNKSRQPQVRTSQQLTTAAAVGAVCPKILLPQLAATEDQRVLVRAALAHEWAHIRHGDLWLLALERLLLPLLAWQPLFWWLRRSVRLDLELLADAAAAGEQPVEYAEALLAWAKTAGRAPAGLAALSLWESPHSLSRRVTMLLDSRSNPSRAGRRWQVLVAGAALALIGGLSLVSLRPQTAGGQEARPLPVADTEIVGPPILIQCLVLEADRVELAKALPVEDRPQPSPETDISIQSPEEWKERLAKLTAQPGTIIISRPQIMTLDGQAASVVVGSSVPLPPESATDPAPRAKEVGLKLRIHPTLADKSEKVALALEAELVTPQGEVDGRPAFAERKLSTKALVPLGKTIVVASRPSDEKQRPVVLAFHVQLAQRGDDLRPMPVQPLVQAADAQEVIRRLKEQLDQRVREADAQRDQSEALRRQVEELKSQLEKLSGGERQNNVFRLKHAKATEAGKALQLLLEQAVALGSDPQINSVQVAADDQANSLIVAAPQKYSAPIQAIIARLDQPAAASATTADPTAPRNVQRNSDPKGPLDRPQLESGPALNLRSAPIHDETQLQLAKLDVQEAEIGLQAAKRDLDRVRTLYEKSAVSQEELSKSEFQIHAAEIKLQRTKIILEGMIRQLAKPPLNAVDGPAPPHTPR